MHCNVAHSLPMQCTNQSIVPTLCTTRAALVTVETTSQQVVCGKDKTGNRGEDLKDKERVSGIKAPKKGLRDNSKYIY